MPFGTSSLGSLGGVGNIVGFVTLEGTEQFVAKLNSLNDATSKTSKLMSTALNASIIAGAAAFVTATKSAVEFESSFAGILKTTDGLTDNFGRINDAGKELADQFRQLALEVPLSVNELNRIGELGGQLGIAKSDLLAFTRVIAELGSTTNITFEAGATSLAQFINITRNVVPAGTSVQTQLESISSAIVDLGNKSVATESGIMEFGLRIAGAGSVAGLSQSQILSFSAALASVGLEAEAGGTAFSKLLINLKAAVEEGGPKLSTFAEIVGVSAEQFKESFQNDAAGAVVSFLEALNRTQKEGGSVISVLESLDIKEQRMRDALLRASGAGDLFNETLKTGNKAYKDATAMSEEYRKRLETTEAQMKLFKNAVNEALISLGQEFLPILKNVATALSQHPEAIRNVIILITGVGGIVGAYKLWTASHKAWEAISASKSFNTLASALNGTQVAQDLLTGSMGAQLAKTTLLGAAVAVTAYELDNLFKAMSECEKSIKLLNDATDLNVSTNNTAINNLHSMVDAMTQLRQHGGDELVSFNGKVVTVSKAISDLQPLFDQTKNSGQIFATEVSISFDKTRISTESSKQAIENYKTAVENLKKAGVDTTAQMLSQISTLENLRTAFSNDDYASKQLTDKIVELYSKMLGLDEAGYQVSGSMRQAKDNTSMFAETLNTSSGMMDEVVAQWKAQHSATEETNNSWVEYSQLIHEVTGKMGPAGDAINVIVDALVSGGDPLVTALNLAVIAWDFFTGKEEKVILSTDEVIDRVFGARSEMDLLYESVSNISSEWSKYDIVQQYADRVDYLSQQLTDLYNAGDSSSASMNRLKTALSEALQQLQSFEEASQYLNPTIIQETADLVDQLAQAWQYFGGSIPVDVMDAFGKLITEQILKLGQFVATLNPSSQAWADAMANLMLLNAQWDIMNGRVSSVEDYLNRMAAAMANAGMQAYTVQQLLSIFQSMGMSADAARTAVQNWLNVYLNAMNQMGPSNPSYQAAMNALYAMIQQAQRLGVPINFSVNGQINIPPLSDSQLRTLYAGYVLHMKDLAQAYYSYSSWLGQWNGGNILLHDGGPIEAHDGLSMNTKGYEEIPFIGLKGEYVNRNAFVEKYGAINMDLANRTLDASYLTKNTKEQPINVTVNPTFNVNEAGPDTYVVMTDKYIHPRIRDNDDRRISSNRFRE